MSPEPKNTKKERKPRSRLRRLLVFLLLVEGVYCVVGSGLLSSGLAEKWLNRRSEKTTMSWAWAWTPVPAVFVVHDLELSGRNPRWEWALAVDRAVALIDPLALGHRTVRSRWLHGSGVGADLRPHQLPAEPAAAPRDGGRPPWTLVLDGIDVSARKPIRFNQFHLQGDGGIRGSMRKVVRGPFAADSLRLEIARGELIVDSERIAHQLELVADLAIAPFVPREHRGQELRFVSATVALQGEVLGLGSLIGPSSLELGDGAALSANLRIAAGKLVPDSRIGLEAPHLEARLAGWTAVAAAAVAADVEAEGDGIQTRVRVELKDLKLRERGETGEIRSDRLKIAAHALGPELGPGGGWRDPNVVVDGGLRFVDLPLAGGGPEGSGIWRLYGTSNLHGEVRVDDNAASGELRLGGGKLGIALDDYRVEGGVEFLSVLAHGDLESYPLELSHSRLQLTDFVEPGRDDSPVNGWWGDLNLAGGTVTLGRPFGIRGRLLFKLRDSRPIVGLFLEEKPALVRVLRNVVVIRDVEGRSQLQLDGAGLRLDDLALHGLNFEVLAQLHFSRKTTDGLLFARYRKLSAAVQLHERQRDWKLTGSREWYEEKLAAGKGG